MKINNYCSSLILFCIFLVSIVFISRGFIDLDNEILSNQYLISIPHHDKIVWASYYDYELNGEWYSKTHATAASREYPRGSNLMVVGMDTGRYIKVRINDYGPESCSKENNYHQSGDPKRCIERQLDLSSYAYKQVCNIPRGLCRVKIIEL